MAPKNLGVTWKKNLFGLKEPMRFPVLFQGGSAQAVKSGEILDISGGNAVPLAADKAMAAIIVIAASEVRAGDLAGYREVIVPRPGDIFEYPMAAAGNPAPGASLYFNDSQSVKTAGANVLGNVCDKSMIPVQGAQSVAPSFDATTTLRTVSNILMTFKAAASYYAALQL